ncbi:MAG: protein kinase [Deltaproteobacteria bacterium]|nr:protein kinase [Deltaproteobacteria bacterium]
MQQLGKYRLESLIATGGMAEVYRASIVGPSGFVKTVCVKRVRPEMADDPEFVEMFESEARIAATLDSPHVVQVFDFDRIDGQLVLAMEYVDGLDLRHILKAQPEPATGLPQGFAVHVIAGLLAALKHAHGQTVDGVPRPVVHRDVSPHNILISTEGLVKLADFGIAKAAGLSGATRTGVVKGKLAYLSPEQAGGDEVGPKSDLYGAGLVLYEMLIGRRLFEGGSDQEIVAHILAAGTPSLPHVAPKLDAVVRGLLAPRPSDRFPDAKAALDALGSSGVPDCGDAEAGRLVKAAREACDPSGSGPEATRTSAAHAGGTSAAPAPRGGRSLVPWLFAAASIALLAALYALFGREPAGAAVAASSQPFAATPARQRPASASPVLRLPEPAAANRPAAGPRASAEDEIGQGTQPAQGFLQVNVRPWARVRVDGVDRGTTPIDRLKLPVGVHKVLLVNDALSFNQSVQVEVRSGRTSVLNKQIR